MIAFVDDHRDRFGVAPICRVLTEHGVPIASDSYYAHKTRAPSRRSTRDARVLAEIERVHADPQLGRGLYGVRKVHAALGRQGGVDEAPVSRRLVERLMHSAGIQGARRGRRFVTTKADKAASRPPDRVHRAFTALAPNRLWVVDFTYVPTWSGMAFTAFVNDVFSRRIVGWRTASRMPTDLPLDALEMALWTRQRQGVTDDNGRLEGLIQHSDAGSQGGFNCPSQHLDREVEAWLVVSVRSKRALGRIEGRSRRRGRRRWPGARIGSGSGRLSPAARGLRTHAVQRACRGRSGSAGFATLAA